ncbi:MAG: hypothetical protein RI910_2872 [Verrucomicrobiota bacterium]
MMMPKQKPEKPAPPMAPIMLSVKLKAVFQSPLAMMPPPEGEADAGREDSHEAGPE